MADEGEFHQDADAAIAQITKFLEEKPLANQPLKPARKKARPSKYSETALALVHSLRTSLRALGGLETPFEEGTFPVVEEIRSTGKSVAKPVAPSIRMVKRLKKVRRKRKKAVRLIKRMTAKKKEKPKIIMAKPAKMKIKPESSMPKKPAKKIRLKPVKPARTQKKKKSARKLSGKEKLVMLLMKSRRK